MILVLAGNGQMKSYRFSNTRTHFEKHRLIGRTELASSDRRLVHGDGEWSFWILAGSVHG